MQIRAAMNLTKRILGSKNLLLVIAILISSFLVVAKNSFGFSVPSMILLAVYSLFLIILHKERRVAFYFFLIPSNTSDTLYFVHVAFMLLILLDFMKRKVKQFPSIPVLTLIFLLIGYEVIHEFIVAISLSVNHLSLVGFIVCCVNLLFLAITYRHPGRDSFRTAIAWSVGVLVLATSMAITQFNYGGFSTGDVRLGSPATLHSFAGQGILWQDPNYLGMYIIAGIVGILILGRGIKSVLSCVVLALLLVAGLMTGSRGFLLSLAVLIVLYFISGLARSRVRMLGSLLIGLVAIIVGLYYSGLLPFLVDMFNGRMDTTDVSNGRLDLYSEYLAILLSNPLILLLGVGLVVYPTKINELFHTDLLMVHNSIIEVFVIWGIVGFLILAVLLFYMYKVLTHDIRGLFRKLPVYIPLVIFIVSTLTITIFYSYHAILLVVFLVIQESRLIADAMRAKERQNIASGGSRV